MIIAFACDHGGFPLRDAILGTIEKNGDNVIDFGIKVYKPVDFPDYVVKICEAMLAGKAERGIIACGSGIGACIAANKYHGIYASVCHDVYSAHQGLSMTNEHALSGGRVIGTELAAEIVRAFLNARIMEENRYIRRVNKIKKIERRG